MGLATGARPGLTRARAAPCRAWPHGAGEHARRAGRNAVREASHALQPRAPIGLHRIRRTDGCTRHHARHTSADSSVAWKGGAREEHRFGVRGPRDGDRQSHDGYRHLSKAGCSSQSSARLQQRGPRPARPAGLLSSTTARTVSRPSASRCAAYGWARHVSKVTRDGCNSRAPTGARLPSQ